MKKVMVILLLTSMVDMNNTFAQKKSMPMTDTTMRRDNMKMRMDNIPMNNMPIIKDDMPDKAYERKMDKTVNRMNRDTAIGGRYRDNMPQETALNGWYKGQRIRSDTIRNGTYSNGMKLKNKNKPKNKKESDGTQNGKYNYEMSRDSMPNAENIDPYKKRYGSKYGDKMARNSTGMTEEKMRAQMAKENRGVLMHRDRTMIIRNGQQTFIKSYTYLSYGTKVMSEYNYQTRWH